MPIDDFKVQISETVLGNNASSDLKKQLKNLKGLSVTVDKILLRQSVMTDIKKSLVSTHFKLKVEMDDAALKQQAQNIGRDTGTTILNAAQKALKANNPTEQIAPANNVKYKIDTGRQSAEVSAVTEQLQTLIAKAKDAGNSGASSGETVKSADANLRSWINVNSIITEVFKKVKQAATELIAIDNILTEISKTSTLTTSQLQELGNASFETADKYGTKASNYLHGVQEMYRAGYENAAQLAELSTLAQRAGNMGAELANEYIIASDAAYGYSGNVQKLNDLLDSQSQVTGRNAVNMEELVKATKAAAGQLSSFDINESEMTALLSTGISGSHKGGEAVGNAVKGIIMNLQQAKGETGVGGEIVDEKSLARVEARCHKVGVELEYMKDGIVRLRNPMEILKELAGVYNSLSDDSADKAGIISDIGGKNNSDVFSAILSNWDKYEKMLSDYENATGSALKRAMESANNWDGSLNRLSNTWTETVHNVANSDGIIAGINALNNLLNVVNNITDSLGSVGSIGAIAGLFAGIQNVGSSKIA